jgi:hypothetical protein
MSVSPYLQREKDVGREVMEEGGKERRIEGGIKF